MGRWSYIKLLPGIDQNVLPFGPLTTIESSSTHISTAFNSDFTSSYVIRVLDIWIGDEFVVFHLSTIISQLGRVMRAFSYVYDLTCMV